MTNSINLYLNGLNNNPFIQQTVLEEDQSIEDYNFVSKTYDPTIETEDEEGIVDEANTSDSKTSENNEKTPLQDLASGLWTIGSGTVSGALGIVGDSLIGMWNNGGEFCSGLWNSTVGGLKILSTPLVGVAKGIGGFYNKTVTGIKQIFRGNIISGLGSMIKGTVSLVTEPLKWAWGGVKKIAKGVSEVAKSVGKTVVSAGKAVVKGIVNVGKAIGKGIKKIFSGW